ncbi:MAG: ABC transporter permease subunit [Candidatus Brocadiia bacterium]
MHEFVAEAARRAVPVVGGLRRMVRRVDGALGCVLLCVVLAAALLGPLAAPHDPGASDLSRRLQGSSARFPLGTDELGRCVLSRVLAGARFSVGTGMAIVAVSLVTGAALGAVAGYAGGALDRLIMGAVDAMLAFPGLVLAIVIAGVLGAGLFNTMLALAAVHWTAYARITRGTVLSAKTEPYVEAARAQGAGTVRLLTRHILPNCVSPLIVMATFGLGHMVLAASALSFLGLGVQPPTPEWGAMLNRGRDFLLVAPHVMTWPGLAITVTVLGFNLAGDTLRDAMDVHQPARR